MQNERIGIIDIGSNSIRLVVYERTETGAYRVIDESKESARLSEKIDDNGRLPGSVIAYVTDTLRYFKMLCLTHKADRIRAVATAAIRNAANSREALDAIRSGSGIDVEVLSGEEEARIGFLGMINTIPIGTGFLVDIGGGSTEVTYFENRRLVKSVSFPFGSVNTTKRYSRGGQTSDGDLQQIRRMIEAAVDKEPWIRGKPGLPLVGLGGTIRNVCKIDQKRKRYSLQHAHNYEMRSGDVRELLNALQPMTVEERKSVEGLSKERADIIVPGMVIMNTIFEQTGASHYLISGAGLRDGLFYETMYLESPKVESVLEDSLQNLLRLHPSVPAGHVAQVDKLAHMMFQDLHSVHGLGNRSVTYLHAAALLYRIGVTINYYDYYKHTFYLIAHSRIYGLSHREIVLCALIASFRSAKKTRAMLLPYRDILTESDYQLAVKLGALLQLAIALDRSETQPVIDLRARVHRKELAVQLRCRHTAAIELRHVQAIEKEFRKIWGLQLHVSE